MESGESVKKKVGKYVRKKYSLLDDDSTTPDEDSNNISRRRSERLAVGKSDSNADQSGEDDVKVKINPVVQLPNPLTNKCTTDIRKKRGRPRNVVSDEYVNPSNLTREQTKPALCRDESISRTRSGRTLKSDVVSPTTSRKRKSSKFESTRYDNDRGKDESFYRKTDKKEEDSESIGVYNEIENTTIDDSDRIIEESESHNSDSSNMARTETAIIGVIVSDDDMTIIAKDTERKEQHGDSDVTTTSVDALISQMSAHDDGKIINTFSDCLNVLNSNNNDIIDNNNDATDNRITDNNNDVTDSDNNNIINDTALLERINSIKQLEQNCEQSAINKTISIDDEDLTKKEDINIFSINNNGNISLEEPYSKELTKKTDLDNDVESTVPNENSNLETVVVKYENDTRNVVDELSSAVVKRKRLSSSENVNLTVASEISSSSSNNEDYRLRRRRMEYDRRKMIDSIVDDRRSCLVRTKDGDDNNWRPAKILCKRWNKWQDSVECLVKLNEDVTSKHVDWFPPERIKYVESKTVVKSPNDDTTILLATDKKTDRLEKKTTNAVRIKTINEIVIGEYLIQTWYQSPYPMKYLSQPKLFLCELCLQYYTDACSLLSHGVRCTYKAPPGSIVYRRDNLAIFKVDGSIRQTYCQNLCLLGKLYIDNKSICFDIESFVFYVLCKLDKYGARILGYFSKEKFSADGNNLACILVLPPYQQTGYGSLLISFSYELNRIDGTIGGPEKPISDLGMTAYGVYWKWIVLNELHDILIRTRRLDEMNEKENHVSNDDDEDDDDILIAISEISRNTGITKDDICKTLYSVNLIRFWRNERTISFSLPMLKRELQRCKRPKLLVDRSCVDYGTIIENRRNVIDSNSSTTNTNNNNNNNNNIDNNIDNNGNDSSEDDEAYVNMLENPLCVKRLKFFAFDSVSYKVLVNLDVIVDDHQSNSPFIDNDNSSELNLNGILNRIVTSFVRDNLLRPRDESPYGMIARNEILKCVDDSTCVVLTDVIRPNNQRALFSVVTNVPLRNSIGRSYVSNIDTDIDNSFDNVRGIIRYFVNDNIRRTRFYQNRIDNIVKCDHKQLIVRRDSLMYISVPTQQTSNASSSSSCSSYVIRNNNNNRPRHYNPTRRFCTSGEINKNRLHRDDIAPSDTE